MDRQIPSSNHFTPEYPSEIQSFFVTAANEWSSYFDAMADGVSIHNPDGTILEINQAMCQLLGKSYEEMLGKKCYEIFHGLDSPIHLCPMHFTQSTLSRESVETFEPHLNKWLSVSTSPILNDQGKVGQIVHVVRDITERKRVEEAAEKEHAKLAAMIFGMKEGVVFADAENRIIEVNDYFCQFVKNKRSNILGKNLNELHQGKIREIVLELVSKFKSHPESEPIHLQRKIETADVLLRVQPIYRDGQYDGVLLNVIDVSELARAKQNAEEMSRQAIAASQSKSEFLANMSHEIRTPLNAILGFAAILGTEKLSREQKEFVDIITQAGRNLLNLINDILDFSKIEAGKLDVDCVETSLPEIIAELENLLQPAAKAKNLDFKITHLPSVPDTIISDPVRLKQCLTNLLNNAIKFTESGSVCLSVNIEMIADYPFIRFDVADTGIGIPEEKALVIFQAFSQADGSTTRKYGGTGLGLSITRKLAQLLGGTVTMKSHPGRGSTFSLMIPANVDITAQPFIENKPGDHRTDNKTSPENPKYSGQVLVVEDIVSNRKLIMAFLQNAGLNIMIAENGEAAIQSALNNNFDMIFMDMQMPVMSGYEAAQILRRQGYKAPIIALTAHALIGDKEKCLQAGCSDYISKPVDPNKLYQMLDKYLTANDARDQSLSTAISE